MGSNSDYSTMKFCEKILKFLKINYETNIVSAHRTPERMFKYAKSAENNNISVIIAGAGGSAHLPGMMKNYTELLSIYLMATLLAIKEKEAVNIIGIPQAWNYLTKKFYLMRITPKHLIYS